MLSGALKNYFNNFISKRKTTLDTKLNPASIFKSLSHQVLEDEKKSFQTFIFSNISLRWDEKSKFLLRFYLPYSREF